MAARDIIEEEPADDGMQGLLTGDLGFGADARRGLQRIDTTLLFATVILVLVLLGAIYRAVLVALTPADRRLLRLHGRLSASSTCSQRGAQTVSSNSTSILIVLMFGVGTDYCLLFVSRYREELHRLEDKHDAMAQRPAPLGAGDPRRAGSP